MKFVSQIRIVLGILGIAVSSVLSKIVDCWLITYSLLWRHDLYDKSKMAQEPGKSCDTLQGNQSFSGFTSSHCLEWLFFGRTNYCGGFEHNLHV